MLTLLPWIVLLGASVELPAAVLLRDGCDQMEDFTYRTLTTAGEEEPALLRAREPVYGFMTGCVESDPMVTYLLPNPNPSPSPSPKMSERCNIATSSSVERASPSNAGPSAAAADAPLKLRPRIAWFDSEVVTTIERLRSSVDSESK